MQLPVFAALVTIGTLLGGAVGTAMGVGLHYMITQPLFVWSVYRRVGITAREIAGIYLRPTAFAAISVGVGLLFSSSAYWQGN